MYDVIALQMDIVAKTNGLAPKLNHFYCYLLAKKDYFLVHLYNYSRALFFFLQYDGSFSMDRRAAVRTNKTMS